MAENRANLSPVDIAVAFTEAWTGHDMDTAARYLADDVTFEGPLQRSAGIEAYMKGLEAFAKAVTGMKVLAALGDDRQALIMYEVETAPFGNLTCAEHLAIRNGKIEADRLTFDTFPVRTAQSGQTGSRSESS